MSLLVEFLAIVQDWRAVFPQQRTFQRGVRQALGSLVCRAVAASPASSGPTAARTAVGARSIFSIPAVSGSRSGCFRRS
jgi:hypothetical protein